MFPEVKFIFYPLSQAIAIVVFFFSMRAHLKVEQRYNKLAIGLTALYVFCNGVMAKIFHFAFRSDEPVPLTSFLNPLFYFKPGFWGWLVAFLPLASLFPFVIKVNRLAYFRALALTMPFIIALQKVACFVAGCCPGDASDLPWAVVFPRRPESEFHNVPVHPNQIYDMLLALSWYGILRFADRRKAIKPYLFPFFLLLYGVSRFLTEMLRPAWRDGLSGSQKLEIIAIVSITLLLIFGRKIWLKLLDAKKPAVDSETV